MVPCEPFRPRDASPANHNHSEFTLEKIGAFMAILKIARLGHPVLRRRAEPVADGADPAIQRLIADMTETLIDAEGAGLAAPQVHQPVRVIMFQVPPVRARARESEEVEVGTIHTLINPEITALGEDMRLGLEGCLSMPDYRGMVPRATWLRYRGQDAAGRPVERVATGFHARVIQHEVDHLDGVIFLDRMADMGSLTHIDEVRHLVERLETVQPPAQEPE